MFVAENETELGRALMKSSSLYFDIQTRERVNAGESFPWEIASDWQNDQKGVCSSIHFRPEESIEACIGTPLSIFRRQALFPCLSTVMNIKRRKNN